MTCEQMINDIEKKFGRKLTKEEKKKIRDRHNHPEIDEEVKEEVMSYVC